MLFVSVLLYLIIFLNLFKCSVYAREYVWDLNFSPPISNLRLCSAEIEFFHITFAFVYVDRISFSSGFLFLLFSSFIFLDLSLILLGPSDA